jgi:hypothetical protein
MFNTFDHVAAATNTLLSSTEALKAVPGILQDANDLIRIRLQARPPAEHPKVQIFKDLVALNAMREHTEVSKELVEDALADRDTIFPLFGDLGIIEAFDLIRNLEELGWTHIKINYTELRWVKRDYNTE